MPSNKKIIESFYTKEKREFNAKYLWWHYTFEKLAVTIAGYILPYNISANLVSSISLIFGLLGCFMIAIDPERLFFFGIILVVIWQILDDVDGHIARSKEATKLGKYLDDSGANIMYAFFYASLGMAFLSLSDHGFIILNQIFENPSSISSIFVMSGFLSSLFLSLQAILSFHHKLLMEPQNIGERAEAVKINDHSFRNTFIRVYKYFVSNVLEFPGLLVPLVLFSYLIGYLSIFLLFLALFNLMNLVIKYFSIIKHITD